MKLYRSLSVVLAVAAGCSSSSEATLSSDPVSLGGVVSGLAGNGEVTLITGDGEELVIAENGAFEFSTQVAVGSSYQITLEESAVYSGCEITGASGTADDTSVTTIMVDCPNTTFAESDEAAIAAIGADDLDTAGAEMSDPWGNAAYAQGYLFVPDYGNNRVLIYEGIPTESGAEPVAVLGQENFDDTGSDTTINTLAGPLEVASDGTRLAVLDYDNSRVLIYNTLPIDGGLVDADVVLGQDGDFSADEAAAGQGGLTYPAGLYMAAGRLLIADSDNNRILIWNAIPDSSDDLPDVVLGQEDFDATDYAAGASGLDWPSGVWTDGTRIVVADYSNNRVLIWNTWPASNATAADVVLGQEDMDSTGSGLSQSETGSVVKAVSNGRQFYALDYTNDRVLIWDEFPTESFTPADRVIGQSDFETDDTGTSATRLNRPYGMALVGEYLILTDYSNERFVVYDGK